MPPIPSTLADEVARLGTATTSVPAPVWLPDAVHALIMACLARLFGRLEEMIRLWQAGLLPPPPAPRPRAAASAQAQPRNPAHTHVRSPRPPAAPCHTCLQADSPVETNTGSSGRRTAPAAQPGFAPPSGQMRLSTPAPAPSRRVHGPPHAQTRAPPFKNRRIGSHQRTRILLRYRIYQRIPTTADFGNRSVRHSSPVRRST